MEDRAKNWVDDDLYVKDMYALILSAIKALTYVQLCGQLQLQKWHGPHKNFDDYGFQKNLNLNVVGLFTHDNNEDKKNSKLFIACTTNNNEDKVFRNFFFY